MKIAIIGTGYVGLTTAVVLAYLNHDVAAVDKDEDKLTLLHEGKVQSMNPASKTFLKMYSIRSVSHRVWLKLYLKQN